MLAVAGFATLSIGDAVLKSMAGLWPVTAVAALRFSIGAIALSAMLAYNEGAAGFRPARPWLQVARGVCLAGASLSFFSAIFVMPLAETMAITFLSPVLTALLSGPLLGEKVRQAVWIACLFALVGVALILRPNLAELGWPAVLPLVSAVFFSLMIIANRASTGSGSALAMQAYMALIAAPILILASVGGEVAQIDGLRLSWPSVDVIFRCAFVALTASTAHWLVYLGTTSAGASQIAPASYIQMLVATLLGWWFFGDVPDAITMAGAAIIIGAGLYLWRDGAQKG
ncbi:DMT family transporter [Altererythrobacter sp.]|uniref:DMT family transporter n=1 Tax=Altererythrobacter sp. TaxID=1872480 RepID=UPI00257CB4A9|nr:DMT family transporter [Altererythrobacter sp.]